MGHEKLHTGVRREQIAEAALSLLASEGLPALSVVKLARRVGIAPSAIYRHFRSKDEVLFAALDRFRDTLLGNVTDVCNETPDAIERLTRLLSRQARMIRENAAVMPRMAFSAEAYGRHPERKARVREVIKAYIERVADVVRQGQRDGRLREDVEPETVALMILGIIQPAGILWHMSDGVFDVTRYVERAWKVLRSGIEKT
jgi:AcrR family transcriptional regulator